MPTDQYLERLMQEYGDSIFRMCYLYLKDYHLAEDAVQETFIKAMKSYDSFAHKSSEKTWLIRIAINTCKNIMRNRWFQIIQNNLEDHIEKIGRDVGKKQRFRGYHATECERQTNHPIVLLSKSVCQRNCENNR